MSYSDFQDESLELAFNKLGLRHIHSIRGPLMKNIYLANNIISLSILLGLLFIYSAFLSKLLPDTGYWILDSMKHDCYYCYLIPLLLLPTYIIIWLNWISSQIFEHN